MSATGGIEPEPAVVGVAPPSPPTNRSATFIGAFALAGRITERVAAFAQILLIASVYGSAAAADVYFAASIAPLLIGTLVGESAAAVALPALVRREGGELRRLIGAGFWATLGLTVVALALYLAVIGPLVELRLKGEFGRLGPWLAFAPLALGAAAAGYFGAVLLRHERYVWPPFRTALAGVTAFVLTAVAFAVTRDVVWAALALTAGYVVSAVVLALEARHVAGRGLLRFPRRADLRELASLRWRLGAGIGSGLLGGQVIVLLERALAASLGPGAVASLAYARGVAFTPNVVGHSIAAGLYPGMVREHARDKVHHVRLRLLRGVRLTLFFGVAVGAFLALFGPNLVGFLLQRGAFGSDEVARVGPALSAFALGLAGSVLVIFLARVFQSIDFFRATVWTQATILVSYVALAYPLRETWGLVGLAIAFGIAQMLGAFVAVALAVWRLDVPRAAFVAEAVRPALDRAATVVLVLAGYRVLLELVDVPVALTGVAYVGGSTLLLLALSAALLWTSDWAESRRTVQAVRSLLRRI